MAHDMGTFKFDLISPVLLLYGLDVTLEKNFSAWGSLSLFAGLTGTHSFPLGIYLCYWIYLHVSNNVPV